ncbi:ANK3, partial [Symbiodinium pilosum]
MPADPESFVAERGKEAPLFALWIAAAKCHMDIAKKLLTAGAQVNRKTDRGVTPLCAAVAFHGDWDMVQLLIKWQADLELADNNGKTPFWMAAEHGRVKIAELLILLGANPKTPNAFGQSPLWAACNTRKLEFVQFLVLPQLSLQETADVNEADDSGMTPLFVAAWQGEFNIASLLLFA